MYLGEVAQHMIELSSRDGAGMPFKAFELNPLAGRNRAGETAEVWVPCEQVIGARRGVGSGVRPCMEGLMSGKMVSAGDGGASG